MAAELELKDFVSATLTQIAEGIADAKEKTKGTGLTVNPTGHRAARGKSHSDIHGTPNLVHFISFDVAVVSTKGTKTEGGVGVFIAPFSLGTRAGSSKETGSVSKIQFEVPISYPEDRQEGGV